MPLISNPPERRAKVAADCFEVQEGWSYSSQVRFPSHNMVVAYAHSHALYILQTRCVRRGPAGTAHLEAGGIGDSDLHASQRPRAPDPHLRRRRGRPGSRQRNVRLLCGVVPYAPVLTNYTAYVKGSSISGMPYLAWSLLGFCAKCTRTFALVRPR